MNRLLGIEVRRFFARRLTRLTIVALFIGVVIAGISMAVTSSRDVSGAQRSAAQSREQYLQSQAAARQDCLAHVPPDQAAQQCPPEQADLPPDGAFYHDPRFSFEDHVADLIRAGTLLGGLAAVLLAASFIGAEWQAGTLATLLTWEPRRVRVAGAKLAAAVGCSLAIAAVMGGLQVAVAAVVAGTRGTLHSLLTDHPPQPHFATQTLAMAGRGACIVAILAAISGGLALLLRHTVAALGVFIGYLIVGEAIVGSLRHGDMRHHLLQSRFAALLDGTYKWFVPVRGADGGIGFSPDHVKVVHALAAGLELTAVAGLVALVAVIALQRRDIT